jgi:hypothetical protein
VGFVEVGRSVADDSERIGRVSSSSGWFSNLALAGRWLEAPATGAAAVVSRQAHRSQDEGEGGGGVGFRESRLHAGRGGAPRDQGSACPS